MKFIATTFPSTVVIILDTFPLSTVSSPAPALETFKKRARSSVMPSDKAMITSPSKKNVIPSTVDESYDKFRSRPI